MPQINEKNGVDNTIEPQLSLDGSAVSSLAQTGDGGGAESDLSRACALKLSNNGVSLNIMGSTAHFYPGEVTTVTIPGNISPGFKLDYQLFGQWGSVTATAVFDGMNTTVTFKMCFAGDTSILNIVMAGNPFGYPQGKIIKISSVSGTVGYRGSLVAVACYLAGTLINTPQGQVPVEKLSIGDKVVTFEEGGTSWEALCWVGQRTVYAHSEAQRPVRVRAHALGKNVPFEDLLITPEHCLYLAGHFIPVRMLVNGISIVVEPLDTFDVYHIETRNHSIVKANGAYAETFLDTGSRAGFSQKNDVVGGSFKRCKEWARDAAAPLGTSRELVEPLYYDILNRARSFGWAEAQHPAAITNDPDLYLEVGPSTFIRPLRRADKGYVFELPAGIRTLWIRSRVGQPSITIGPFVDDRRELGVLIGDITVYGSQGTRELKCHLSQKPLSGWHGYENSTCRWTAGRAVLDLSGVCDPAPSLLMLGVVSAGPYLEADSDIGFSGETIIAIAS